MISDDTTGTIRGRRSVLLTACQGLRLLPRLVLADGHSPPAPMAGHYHLMALTGTYVASGRATV